MEEIIN